MCADLSGGYPYTVEEHDVPPGVTVCCVKDSRGRIVHDGLDIDRAEAIAAGMNEKAAQDTEDPDDQW